MSACMTQIEGVSFNQTASAEIELNHNCLKSSLIGTVAHIADTSKGLMTEIEDITWKPFRNICEVEVLCCRRSKIQRDFIQPLGFAEL
eukprot:6187089-Pleurochrysis_carterae.AAC.7